MKKLLIALAGVAATVAPALSHAEDANPLSFNLSVTSDYRFRGISQSRLDPAVQAGADYALPGGFYIGTWASSIKWIKDAGRIAGIDTGSAPLELDIYGGYKGEITKELTYDVGVLQYIYPSNSLKNIPGNYSPATTELYGALSYGIGTIKYSHAVTRLFGFASSKNSGYLEAAAAIDAGYGVTITPHIGYQKVQHNSNYSYTDYSLTAAKDYWGFTFSGAIVGTDTKDIAGASAYASPNGKNLGRTALVVAVKKTF
jgi:uncharacterized protein (TIGR02001 family)